MTTTQRPAIMVQPIHFEDFDGKSFERLVYAYHARSDRWISLEWFGQTGKDHGRDIVGMRHVDGNPDGEKMFVLCANWKKLTFTKIKKDINRAITSSSGTPTRVRIICGYGVPAGLRDKAKQHASSQGIGSCEVWSGTEFEEHVRATAESLLQRFCAGATFPDSAHDLLMFAWGTQAINDSERLELITRAFVRAAFETPIQQESSLPAFRTAIEDTIRVLNTGIWQTREGNMIQRLPSANDVVDEQAKRRLTAAKRKLEELRTSFDDGVRSRKIQHCGCGQPDCPSYSMDSQCAMSLKEIRDSAIAEFREARQCVGLKGDWT